MVARNVPLVSKEMNVNNVLRGSKEKLARNVVLVSRGPSIKNVRRTTTGMTLVMNFL